jgi:small GTP-binding protein
VEISKEPAGGISMTKLYKLIVTGAFNAGKTTFVETLSDIDIVNTDKITRRRAETKVKPATTVALDYGRVKINNNAAIHLFGTPGQDRFDFMRNLLADGMDGFIFLVDSTDRSTLHKATELLTLFKKRGNVPYLLVANKADRKGLSRGEIRRALNLSKRQPIVSCVATDKASARAVTERLIAMIEAGA